MKTIDNILNKITMYRVVLYELIGLLVVAGIFGFFGILPYTLVSLLFSVAYILAICWLTNKVFAWAYNAPNNPESTYITALILALIITPALSFGDTNFLILAFWASSLAIASKYILAIGKKHIFNPAAIGVVITAFVLNQSASWWVGTAVMLPFVLFGGFLITHKIKRFDLVLSSIIAGFIVILGLSFLNGGNVFALGWSVLVSTPLIFFTTVMLTEPLTSPPTSILRIPYGILTGILFAPAIHLGGIYSTPELSLVIGNIFSYFVSPKKKLTLALKNIEKISPDSYDFIFTPNQRMSYRPGQYMEWTLGHLYPDNRGVRRYFTLASSPTERELRMGIKFYPSPSSFKRQLLEMKSGDTIIASQLAGDFVLPKDKKKKLVFIAGGIGITPFRSMIKYLVDTKEKRDIVLFYSNKNATDIVYEEVFNKAREELGIKTLYAITDPKSSGYSGPVNSQMITSEVPDYKERYFYISGPHSMIVGFQKTLKNLGVKKSHIKTDFFPGFV
jgi:ferredoxin-NADP reductase